MYQIGEGQVGLGLTENRFGGYPLSIWGGTGRFPRDNFGETRDYFGRSDFQLFLDSGTGNPRIKRIK